MYQEYLKAINRENVSFQGGRLPLQKRILEQWTLLRNQILDKETPQYEPYCLGEKNWSSWLIAQKFGWPSYDALLSKIYDLMDLVLCYAEFEGYYLDIMNCLGD